MSKKTLLCDQWEFSKNPIGTKYADGLDWRKVDIPHDWLIYDTRNLYETSTGWYRRKLYVEKKQTKCMSLRFEGVYMDSSVYVNGALAGEWKYGYSTFEFDITDFLSDGENEISVCVDYHSPNSRWYSGAGIYRRVWLKEYSECHITNDGIYISADMEGNVTVTTEVERPQGVSVSELSVHCAIVEGDRVLAETTSPCCAFDKSRISENIYREGCSYSVNTSLLKVADPILWDIENPKLYMCVCEILQNGRIVDREESSFGFRKIEFTADRGFFLNERHVKLHGSCEHHDLGSLGAAVNRAAVRRKLEKLRTMGVNAIRTSHNMPAVELMELADEMGFLVLSEGFDMWERHKTDCDYALFFPKWIRKDVASWIRRDRNHPSIIGWSIGNEIYDTHADDRGQEITSMLSGLVREHDFRSNGYITIGSNYMQWSNGQRCADILKLAGYNYGERLYEEQHEKHPDWMIYGSETASVVQSRGIYHFPLSQSVLMDDDEQCSSLGNSATGWGAKNTEACIISDRDAEFCAGQFIWTGFDYIGEPTPYSTKNSYFGQIDTAGFSKDSAYIFRAEWTSCESAPFVHIFPYWDFNEGQSIDVRVASNAPKVALFFNDERIAEKEIDHRHGVELTLDTVIEYVPGELMAIAYDEDGAEIARDVQRSFGDAVEIRLQPDKNELKADGVDLIFVEIAAYDKGGTFVANANNRVFVKVSGAGRLVGLDNGDSTDYEQYKGTSRRLFSGKLLAVIAAKTEEGDINMKVTSPTLPDRELILKAVPAEAQKGIAAEAENFHRFAECPDEENDIPVRKISFLGEDRVFTSDRKVITFKTEVYPANASYGNEIEYKLTNVLGIESNLGEIVAAENGNVTVRCNGDGEFFLRALCKNGTKKYHVMSMLPLKGEGVGSAFIDPYSFVAGGLFTVQSGNAGNGIQHGAAFAGENSWFGFENVDFGSLGSDTVTVPVYANCTTPVKIRFYDGIPGQGGELIGDFVYHEPPRWLTYIPNTFQLSKVLRGVHTLVMESDDGFQVQGFCFLKTRREFSLIRAVDSERIYGDKFTSEDDAVTGIGNNVILDFGEFDFTERRPTAVVITGKSALSVNSIHIIFSADTEMRVLAEFEGSEVYTQRSFSLDGLDGIKGRCKVSFVFLPGSNFDFKSFEFI
ncbi:MAG: DUF4982 domain-containing protein [Acetatifactor sp.]|nr:DUF4982 domain-containing protein [Acetatifactor sp.]